MSDRGKLERRDVLKAVGGAGVVVGLTGTAAGPVSAGESGSADRPGVVSAPEEGECGYDAVYEESSHTVKSGGETVHTFERQTDYPCEISVVFDPVVGPLEFEAYLTLNGRTPTRDDHDRYTDDPVEGFTIEGGTLDPGDEVGVLVVVDEAPADGGEYLAVFSEATDELVQPVAEMSVVTNDPKKGEPVQFDASDSFARLGAIESYEWSWVRSLGGDSGNGSGEEFSFVPESDNQYRIHLDVTDTYGNADSAEEYIYVDGEDDGGFCFITTATAREQSTLDSLRRFRDDSMAATPVGRGLVGIYYRMSPPVARALDRHPEGRTARLCRWYVRRCAALSDRQRDLDSRIGTAALGVVIATVYILGVLIAAAGYAGIRLSELLS